MKNRNINFIKGDLSKHQLDKIIFQDEYISIDTETTGIDSDNSDIKLIQLESKGEISFYALIGESTQT